MVAKLCECLLTGFRKWRPEIDSDLTVVDERRVVGACGSFHLNYVKSTDWLIDWVTPHTVLIVEFNQIS